MNHIPFDHYKTPKELINSNHTQKKSNTIKELDLVKIWYLGQIKRFCHKKKIGSCCGILVGKGEECMGQVMEIWVFQFICYLSYILTYICLLKLQPKGKMIRSCRHKGGYETK